MTDGAVRATVIAIPVVSLVVVGAAARKPTVGRLVIAVLATGASVALPVLIGSGWAP